MYPLNKSRTDLSAVNEAVIYFDGVNVRGNSGLESPTARSLVINTDCTR